MSRAGMRRKAADFMASERARSSRLCKGAVQVATNAMLRGAITAIQWVSPPPSPHHVVSSWDEAVAWVNERARAEAMHIATPRRHAQASGL